MYPPPMTSSVSGTRSSSRAEVESSTRGLSMSSAGILDGEEPVATMA